MRRNNLCKSRRSRGQIEFLEPRRLLSGGATIGEIAPAGLTADAFEPNDTLETASDLGAVGDITLNDLSIHEEGNDDYYRIVAAGDGSLTVGIAFTHASGDVDLAIFDSTGELLAYSNSENDDESVALAVEAGESYVIRVYGYNGDVNPDYSMTIDSPALPAAPPQVTGVYVNGVNWTAPFRAYLAQQMAGDLDFGFEVPDGPEQELTLPWTTVDQVSIRFSSDVVVNESDLAVRSARGLAYEFAPASFRYSPVSRVATWTFTAPFVNDRITLDLNGEGMGVHAVGTAGPVLLDGEWTNAGPGGSDTFPSGDGLPGGDFTFRLNVLPGDVNRSASVNALDLGQVRARQLTSTTAPGSGMATYTALHDVNGNGSINAIDLGQVRARQLNMLPPESFTGLFSVLPIHEESSRQAGAVALLAP